MVGDWHTCKVTPSLVARCLEIFSRRCSPWWTGRCRWGAGQGGGCVVGWGEQAEAVHLQSHALTLTQMATCSEFLEALLTMVDRRLEVGGRAGSGSFIHNARGRGK